MIIASDKWFKREMEVLQGIQKIDHPHLIKPIASCSAGHNQGSCFLFPWADGGNLKEFWAKNRAGVVGDEDRDLMLWTLKQMEGLSGALVALHNGKEIHCRHGDLKPENILVFSEDKINILQIADIGLGKFHDKSTYLRQKGKIYTDTKTGTARYLPPEFKTSKQISRLHDVWSLGCLFLEFIIWAAWGNEGLNKLLQLDIEEFWQKRDNESENVVHDDIKRWIWDMGSVLRPKDQRSALGALLEVVELYMLKREGERETSKQIHDRLVEITGCAEHDANYCLNPGLAQGVMNRKLPTGGSGSKSRGQEVF